MLGLRRGFQLAFLGFFLYLFFKARFPYKYLVSSDFFLRFSPLQPLFEGINTHGLSLAFWPALVFWVLALIMGRFFCGWVCPLGTTLDVYQRLVAKFRGGENQRHPWADLKIILLIGCIVAACFSLNIWGILDPVSTLNRSVTAILYPFFTNFSEKTLSAAKSLEALGEPARKAYSNYKFYLMPEAQSYHQDVWAILLFFCGILALEHFSRRFWCRNFCPAGGLLGLLSKNRLWGRKVDETCVNCGKCQRECKMAAIPPQQVSHTDYLECINCYECTTQCPSGIHAVSFQWFFRSNAVPLDFSRRKTVKTILGAGFLGGTSRLLLKNRDRKAKVIRPPGALPEKEFLSRCIRCLQCVRICQSNGKCLQPQEASSGILEMWAPIAVMRTGYCEFNCNLCGRVCPTQAIQELSLGEKQKFLMGMAYFDKNVCIPYQRCEDCLVCEEHCPLPEKAIKFDLKEAILPEGSKKLVKFPYIDRKLCIGCGICEQKCPLPRNPGVLVISERPV